MTTKTLARVIVAVMIAVVLGGASLIIVADSAGSGAEAPAGFFH